MSYQGQTPTNASNLISNQNNGILFSIIDQHIYNKEGYCLGALNTSSDAFSTVEDFQIKGASEILIVPNPANCQQYYIVSVKVDIGVNQKTPYVFLLDMSIPNINAMSYNTSECILGQLVPIGNMSGNYQNIGMPIVSLVNNENSGKPIPPFNNPNDPTPNNKTSNVFLGATPKNAQNTHYVFISNNSYIYRFKITNNGFEFDNDVIPFLLNGNTDYNPYNVRSELEVVNLSNGNMRIACPYYKTISQGVNQVWEWLFIAELNSLGNLIPNTSYHIPFYKNPNPQSIEDVALKGIEFSGNGDYLYISHSTNVLQPNQLEFFDFNSPNVNLSPINIGNLDCKFSVLEKGIDNSIYFSGLNGLHKLTNSNNPNSSILTINSTPGFYNYENNGTTLPFSDLFKLYSLPDQIDGFDYYNNLNNYLGCCLDNINFNSNSIVNVTSNATWGNTLNGGSNPFSTGNTIKIKKSIYIKPGVTLTIQNLNLEFAPDARIVVENGNSNIHGGKLILDGANLTAVQTCGLNSNWLGCEVWGNKTLNQVNASTSNQGVLIMKNNAKIKHAEIAILVGKRQFSTSINQCSINEFIFSNNFIENQSGGIITLMNAQFENNVFGIQFEKYLSPNGVNNLSTITASKFEWNDQFYSNTLETHIKLKGIKGLKIQASTFENNATNQNLIHTGIGIESENSNFNVISKCNSLLPVGVNCTSYIPCKFIGLKFGINTFSTNNFNFSVNRADFKDNRCGVFAVGTKYYQITESKFTIPEISNSGTNGIYNLGGSGFKIEENEFYEEDGSSIGSSYGVIINNSGTSHNEIYNNFYQNLNIGGYSLFKNGTTLNNGPQSGLQWICNRFRSEIVDFDLGVYGTDVSPGIIDYNQGYFNGSTLNNSVLAAARNTFSLFNEINPSEHDISLNQYSQQLNYVYLNNPSQTPDNYSPAVSIIQQQFNSSSVNGFGFNVCPSKLINKPIKLKSINLKVKLDSLQTLIDGGNTDYLLSLLANSTDPYQLLNGLSPYLSDSILKELIFSCASISEKEDLLQLQKPLTSDVCQHVLNSYLPELIKLELILNQGDAPMQKLIQEIGQVKSELDQTYSNYIGNLLLDTTITYLNIIDSLTGLNFIDAKKDIISLLISHQNNDSANVLLNEICECDIDFQLMMEINKHFSNVNSINEAINLSPSLLDSIQMFYNNTNNVNYKEILNSIINYYGNTLDIPEIPQVSSTKSINVNNLQENLNEKKIINVFPIPSSGVINLVSKEALNTLVIKVTDMNGRIVFKNTLEEFVTSQIDLSSLSNGEYILEFALNNVKKETVKIEIKK
jgi:hypothetical protein